MTSEQCLDAIKILRAAVKIYAPCSGCGNGACEAMHMALAVSDGLVEDEEIFAYFTAPVLGPQALAS